MSGCDDGVERVCPRQPFALPAAPAVAARAEGRSVDPALIRASFDASQARHDALVVEGAGGLLVPLAPGFTMADLAADFGLPVLVVARARLGTINRTLLTLEAIRTRGLPLAGVVVSHPEGPLSEARTANIIMQVLRSLMEAHEVGIVHRDVKPGNVFVCSTETRLGAVKVLDFGIAKSVDGLEAQVTAAGILVGTPRYMPPEQIRGETPIPAMDDKRYLENQLRSEFGFPGVPLVLKVRTRRH